MSKKQEKAIALLTAGGDCPGLNAAIRAVTKAVLSYQKYRIFGFRDGYRGLAENRYIPLDNDTVSGILTLGGTILGSSRDKIKHLSVEGELRDMRDQAAENLDKLNVECLVVLGGGGTLKNGYDLHVGNGVNIIHLPKTIDNDVWETDVTFGFRSAIEIATEAIDRLHTTATSHHRIIVCEIMGHNTGHLTLNAGIAGGADAILIPEIPYDPEIVAQEILNRRKNGKRFSIVAVAEGAMDLQEFEQAKQEADKLAHLDKKERRALKLERLQTQSEGLHGLIEEPRASRLARKLSVLTGIDARVTTLGHVQRGGTPCAFDRILCTEFGTAAAQYIAEKHYNVMTARKGRDIIPVPIKEVVGKRKMVLPDSPLVSSAKLTGVTFGSRTIG